MESKAEIKYGNYPLTARTRLIGVKRQGRNLWLRLNPKK